MTTKRKFLEQHYINVTDGMGFLTRIYYDYDAHKFFSYINTHENIAIVDENLSNTADIFVTHLNGNCDLTFHYNALTFTKKQREKLSKLMEGDEFSKRRMMELLLLLI